MATITNPVPGTAFSQGVLAGDTLTLAIGTSAANGSTIAYNARWQFNLTGAESTANAGSNLQLQNIADDGFTIIGTPISINRATGVVTINTGSSIEFGDGSVSAPSIAPASNTASGLYFTTNAVHIAANGVQVADFVTATTGVNYLLFTPAATGVAPSLTAAGSDTDVGLILGSKGAGVVSLGGTTIANGSLHAVTTASAVNFLQVTGAATSGTVAVAAAGTDTDIPMTIAGKGAGAVTVGLGTSNTTIGSGAALNTTATVGYIIISTCAGTPTGVPVGHATGNAALVYDTTAHKLWAYDAGTWKGAAFT